jgi:serine/threonine protein kinase
MSQAGDPRLVPLRDALSGMVLRGTGNVSYHLRECIGEGGQGWVFRANYDDPQGHVVIVKVLRPDVVAAEALRRFTQEAEVLRMLSTQGRPNPYIVRFYDHAVAQVPSPFSKDQLTLPFTVLEHVNGMTLEKVLEDAKGRGLAVDRVRRLLRQICQALDVVHAQKIVHRDLKPSNILLATEAGTEIAKVTDFGLVKLVDMNLHKTATLAGASLGYAPPEQYEQGNKRVSARTDVFSLAAVGFEMLSGRPAFPFNEGENPLLIVTRILNGARPSLMKTRATLAPELETRTDIIEGLDRELTKALAADPGARHESIMALWAALEPLLRATAERAVSPYETTARQDSGAPGGPNPSGSSIRTAGSTPPERAPTEPSEMVVPEVRASNPAAWQWTILTTPLAPNSVKAAVWSADGVAAMAVTASGLLRWGNGAWIPTAPPANVPVGAIRGIRRFRDGSFLLFGERGLAARFMPGGPVAILRVPDPEITFHGALAEDNGTTTLVGERPYRGSAPRSVSGSTAGVVLQFAGNQLQVLGDAVNSTRLRAVARLAGGQLVACGDLGALVRIERGAVEHIGAICNGNLLAIAPMPDGGAVTVGSGGHALTLSAKLEHKLEAVQTTRDVMCVATTPNGQAWAGSAAARVLRRTTMPSPSWKRMSTDMGVTSNVIAVWVGPRSVRAIGDDGAVVEGRLE